MVEFFSHINDLPLALKIAVIVGTAVVTHLIVIAVRRYMPVLLAVAGGRRYQKLRSVMTLATSAIVFALYFFSVGLVMQEFGVSLTAYLASASVIGLAIGYGSQGVVQDVVMGMTFIFSDLVDVDDMVEISGQTGVVKAITMRFIELENAMGGRVFIPNRSITNVINYPRGYVRCIVDITLRGEKMKQQQIEAAAIRQMHSVHHQFPGILITEPSLEGRLKMPEGKEILRIKFRIWPNRGQPIETTYLQELLAELTAIDPDYKPWMVAIAYEVEKRIKPNGRSKLTPSTGPGVGA